MKKYKVTLKWNSPKLHLVTEIEALNIEEALIKIKKDSIFNFKELSTLSIKSIK